nr:hypothetical protein [Tanacetum cinerariifolium]
MTWCVVADGGVVTATAVMMMEGDVGGEVAAAEVMAAMVVMIKMVLAVVATAAVGGRNPTGEAPDIFEEREMI